MSNKFAKLYSMGQSADKIDFSQYQTSELLWVQSQLISKEGTISGKKLKSIRAEALYAKIKTNTQYFLQLMAAVNSRRVLGGGVITPFTVEDEMRIMGVQVRQNLDGLQVTVSYDGKTATLKRKMGFIDYTDIVEWFGERDVKPFDLHCANLAYLAACFSQKTKTKGIVVAVDGKAAKNLRIPCVTESSIAAFVEMLTRGFEEGGSDETMTGMPWAAAVYCMLLAQADAGRVMCIGMGIAILYGAMSSEDKKLFTRGPNEHEKKLIKSTKSTTRGYLYQTRSIGKPYDLVRPTPANAQAVLTISRMWRRTDGKGMSAMAVAYDGIMTDKINAKSRNMLAVLRTFDLSKADVRIVCADMTVAKIVLCNIITQCQSITFEGLSTPIDGCKSQRTYADAHGQFLFDLTAEGVPENKKSDNIDEYAAKLTELAFIRLKRAIALRPKVYVFAARLLKCDIGPVGDGCIQYLPGPTPHNMVCLVIWTAPSIAKRRDFHNKVDPTVGDLIADGQVLEHYDTDLHLKLSIFANYARNQFFLTRTPMQPMLAKNGLPFLKFLPYVMPPPKTLDLSGGTVPFQVTDEFGSVSVIRRYEAMASNSDESNSDDDDPHASGGDQSGDDSESVVGGSDTDDAAGDFSPPPVSRPVPGSSFGSVDTTVPMVHRGRSPGVKTGRVRERSPTPETDDDVQIVDIRVPLKPKRKMPKRTKQRSPGGKDDDDGPELAYDDDKKRSVSVSSERRAKNGTVGVADEEVYD